MPLSSDSVLMDFGEVWRNGENVKNKSPLYFLRMEKPHNEEHLDNPVNDIEYQKLIELMDNCREKVDDIYCDLFGDNGKYNCNYDTCPLRRSHIRWIRKQMNQQKEQ